MRYIIGLQLVTCSQIQQLETTEVHRLSLHHRSSVGVLGTVMTTGSLGQRYRLMHYQCYWSCYC